ACGSLKSSATVARKFSTASSTASATTSSRGFPSGLAEEWSFEGLKSNEHVDFFIAPSSSAPAALRTRAKATLDFSHCQVQFGDAADRICATSSALDRICLKPLLPILKRESRVFRVRCWISPTPDRGAVRQPRRICRRRSAATSPGDRRNQLFRRNRARGYGRRCLWC